ncbi:MAG: alpha/beta hydrolase [Proteobacteria bacterium]|nr:alpha/beta hydrolase [Pseudomonadota bacterium]
MIVLFVHGMGKSPISGWPLLYQLKRAGLQTRSFSYLVSLEPFAAIQSRLEKRISEIASEGNYILIGHSLGGVLIRAALSSLHKDIPPPERIFLLGSPVNPSRLAKKFSTNIVFRALTRDCGDLLASLERMSKVSPTIYPTTSIVGVRGIPWKYGPFEGEENDGIVSLSEVSAEWLTDEVRLSLAHGLLPVSNQVARVILQRLNA